MAGYANEHIVYTMEKLMRSRNLDDITVKDIVAAGPVNRKTFYFHFHGIEDLLKWMATRRLAGLSVSGIDSKNWKEKTAVLLGALEENKEFFYTLLHSKYSQEILQYLSGKLKPFIEEFVRNCARETESLRNGPLRITGEQYAYINDYYLNGVLSLISNWIYSGFKEPADKFLDILDNLTKNTIFNVLDAFSAQSEQERDGAAEKG
jgi:AcrR family transcriptional regulator